MQLFFFTTGVILAVLEKMSLLPEFYSEAHEAKNGTVSAGYQNFLICIEMFFGALALKHAFPHHVSCLSDEVDPNPIFVPLRSTGNVPAMLMVNQDR